MNRKTLTLMLAFACGGASADTTTAEEKAPKNTTVEKKLRTNDPNYFVVAAPQTGGELADDVHLEFYVSIQYPMLEWCDNHSLLFIYNGQYDFYIVDGDRYKSAPIISRRQNPGFLYEYDTKELGQFRLGYFHESNGQTLDSTDGKTAFDIEEAQHGKEYALAQTSRGWDYVSLRYHSEDKAFFRRQNIKNRYSAELRTFMPKQMFQFDREDDIFWETVDEQPKVSDYDGLRLMYEVFGLKGYEFNWSARVEVKTGTRDQEAMENVSYRASVFKRCFGLPLMAFYFNGYGKEPSTYNERTEYAGFGLEFR